MADQLEVGSAEKAAQDKLNADKKRVQGEALLVLQMAEEKGGEPAPKGKLNVQDLKRSLLLYKPEYVPHKKNGQPIPTPSVHVITQAWINALDQVPLVLEAAQPERGATQATKAAAGDARPHVPTTAIGRKELSDEERSKIARRVTALEQVKCWLESLGDGEWQQCYPESGAL